MVKIEVGDIIDKFEKGEFHVIVHQANCFCTMGSGIAKALRDKYPSVYEADCKTPSGDIAKLGSYSYTHIKDKGYIVNLYSQYHYGRIDRRHTSYDAFYDGFTKLLYSLKVKEPLIIAVPYKIGCNLGGGDWRIVKSILEAVFANSHHTLLIIRLPSVEPDPVDL
jgi:O-acetyl-ADP-ribose deacetylase (regulator of RNase III)